MAGRFLGIDYGMKRIGVAVSDEAGTLAFPKTILQNDRKAFQKLKEIVRTENIREIVVGESINFKGQPNAIAAAIEIFISELEKLAIPLRREKEFLTSVEARRSLSFGGQIRGDPKEKIDDSAAALILQRYLDRRNLRITP